MANWLWGEMEENVEEFGVKKIMCHVMHSWKEERRLRQALMQA